jgi:hypothetical protein
MEMVLALLRESDLHLSDEIVEAIVDNVRTGYHIYWLSMIILIDIAREVFY